MLGVSLVGKFCSDTKRRKLTPSISVLAGWRNLKISRRAPDSKGLGARKHHPNLFGPRPTWVKLGVKFASDQALYSTSIRTLLNRRDAEVLFFPHPLPPRAAEALGALIARRPYSGAGLLAFARDCEPWSEFRLHTRQPYRPSVFWGSPRPNSSPRCSVSGVQLIKCYARVYTCTSRSLVRSTNRGCDSPDRVHGPRGSGQAFGI
jgi:hypothetical protein